MSVSSLKERCSANRAEMKATRAILRRSDNLSCDSKARTTEALKDDGHDYHFINSL